MSENENSSDRKDLELEIESILEETHYLADQEQMEKNARKYRVKPKMDEIYSNADKKPRLVNKNPLDVDTPEEAEKAPKADNTIVGDKNAATIQAELVLNGNDEKILTPEEADEQARKASEEAADGQEDEDCEADGGEFVTLAPEYDANAEIAGDVIGKVDQFEEEHSHVQSIRGIDIDMDDEDFKKDAERRRLREEKEKEEFERLFGVMNSESGKPLRKVVSKVPAYMSEDKIKTLNVKAGRFSDVLEREYEEYLKSRNPSVISHVVRTEQTSDEDNREKKEDKRPLGERIISAVVGFFSKDESNDDDTPREKSKPIEDYTGEEDVKGIIDELNHNIRKLFGRSVLTCIIAVISVILTVLTRIFPDAICSAVAFAPAAYAVINFILMAFSIFVNRVSFVSGLTPLIKLKGNSDTAVAVGAIAAVLQVIASFFCLGDLSSFNINYYCVIVLIAFFANNCGKLFMVLRVKDNFKFVSSKGQKYAAKIYNNESVANQLLSGTASDRNIIAYQHKTLFPANFLKISYAPDPSEDLSSRLAPVTTLAALLIAFIYGFARGTFTGAINVFCLIAAVAVPVAGLVAVNLPIRRLCKTLLSFGGMLSGYPSVKQFCDSTAIMLDATELFGADCIDLEGIKTFEEYNVDESLLCGIAVLKEAGNPIANVFDSVVAETKETLPDVESVLYEDEMGLVGWIKSERILVGSRQLMEKYNVETPRMEYEDKYTVNGRQVTYIARAGRLAAMIVTKYHADDELKSELQRAEANGISVLVRTTDFNVTNDLVAKEYNLFYRSVKVLPTGLGNVLKEAESTLEENSRSYLITSGKVSSLARAVSGCVKIKHNISLAVVIQLIAVIFGVLVATLLSLYAGVGVMGSLEMLIYALFWGAAAIIAPALQKS